MDGSKRWTLTSSAMRSPCGLTIDFNHMERRIYFADTKLNRIESIRPDGSDRTLVISGTENLVNQPISLDLFGDSVYWVNRINGDLVSRDKYGRGVSVALAKGLVLPIGVSGKNFRRKLL